MKSLIINFFLLLVFTLSLFVSGNVDSQDGLQYLAVARNIYYTGEPTAPLYEYGAENGWKNIHLTTYLGKNGKTYSFTGLGFSLAMIPAVFVTDIFYNLYQVSPPVHFPLESDWLILLTASFTNVFFAAGIGVLILLYLVDLGLKTKTALLISLVGMFSTNLFASAKHILAHTIFTFFMLLAFYLLRIFAKTKKTSFLFLAGLSYGALAISYNTTFLLPLPILIIYYLLVSKTKFNKMGIQDALQKGAYFVLGLLPFIAIYLWFENLRSAYTLLASSYWTQNYIRDVTTRVPITAILEGIYGQLFSVGRSVFLYSPIILLPLLFWHKLTKKVMPEFIVFILMLTVYIVFYSTGVSFGGPDQGIQTNWHGESSWGPRYLIPVIPFGVIVAGYIYHHLTRRARMVVVSPLAVFGLFVGLLGIIMPYQIKFHELDIRFFINYTQYTSFLYSNLLPRHSPIIMMTKKLARNFTLWPQTLNTGDNNLQLIDGIELPFNVGPERWRAIEKKGYITFDNTKQVKSVGFDIINHPIATNAASLVNFQVSINKQVINATPEVLEVGERKSVSYEIADNILLPQGNEMVLDVTFIPELPSVDKPQIFGLITNYINGVPVNKESIDVPFVSPLGPKMTNTFYKYWGEENKDPWKLWDIHTQVYERTPDLWWLRPVYYWDLPKNLFTLLFLSNLVGILFFGKKVYSASKKYKD